MVKFFAVYAFNHYIKTYSKIKSSIMFVYKAI